MSTPVALVDRVVAAHGGPLPPSAVLHARFSSGGLAFASKLQGRALRGLEARVSPLRRETVLAPFPRPGLRAIFAAGAVRIEDGERRVVAERRGARERFRDVRHLLWWDSLDMAYFAGYALWTYLSLPFVLAEPGFEARDLGTWSGDGRPVERVAVRFPAGVHTHSPEQVLHVDGDGLIVRHDYVAEPFGSWAKAAHYCLGYETFDGLRIATRRRVYPQRADGRRRPGPLLVWIDVESVSLAAGSGATSRR